MELPFSLLGIRWTIGFTKNTTDTGVEQGLRQSSLDEPAGEGDVHLRGRSRARAITGVLSGHDTLHRHVQVMSWRTLHEDFVKEGVGIPHTLCHSDALAR